MSVDMFLKLDGIDGESVDHKHAKEIDIEAWTWGLSQSGTTHISKGGGAGKVSVQDITVTKYVDKSTPNLITACCIGKHIKDATLTVRKAGEKPIEYVVIKLKDVLISNISTGGSGGDDRLTESITLNFAEFDYTYLPQKADGSAEGPVTSKFSIAQNTKL